MESRKRPTPEELLEQIGVQDLEDGESYISPFAALADTGPTNRILVRGASAGGSPVLNFVTRAVVVLTVLLVAGGIYGIWRLFRSDDGKPVAVYAEAGESFTCRVWFWHRPPRGILPLSSAAAVGSVSFPWTREQVEAAGGETFQVEGDRVDRFSPAGAVLAVRYVGNGPQVRSVSISFPEPRDRCKALRQVGLLPETNSFFTFEGMLRPSDASAAHPFFQAGGVLRFQAEGNRIAVLQLEAPLGQ